MKTLYLHRLSPVVLVSVAACIANITLHATEYPAPPPKQAEQHGESPDNPCIPSPDKEADELRPISQADRVRATRQLEELRHALKSAHEVKVSLMTAQQSEYKSYTVDEENRRHLLNLSSRVRIAENYSPHSTQTQSRCELEFYNEQGQQLYRFDIFVVRPSGSKESYRLDGALFELDESDYAFYRDLLKMITNHALAG